MPGFDEDLAFGPPRPKPTAHTLGENVDALSAPELEERIEQLRIEIERLGGGEGGADGHQARGGRHFQAMRASHFGAGRRRLPSVNF